MIALTRLRELNLSTAPAESRPRHVSAASGLVRVQSHLYVVVDDELHLAVFPAAGSAPGHLIRLFEGTLPAPKAGRKKQKPDLEALTLLPADERDPHGALLALGSGSTRNRHRAALLSLDAQGDVSGAACIADCSPIFNTLADEFPTLNIEGALICDGEIRLFQRGNRSDPRNAIIRFRLAAVRAMLRGETNAEIMPLSIDVVDIGAIDGIPYSFTDAASLPDGGTLFTAIVEDTPDAYQDGPCAAAAIGRLDRDGGLRWLRPLDHPHKIEGVDARIDGNAIRLLLVTDADDADVPAELFSAVTEI